MIVLSLLCFTLIGLFAGVMAGLLGISGGVITIPLLVTVFSFIGFDQAHMMHTAIGTSFASMLCNAFASANAHRKRDGIVAELLAPLAPGIVLGVIFGSTIAHSLKGQTLQLIFAVFECMVGVYFFLPNAIKRGDPKIPSRPFLTCFGVIVGMISSILGIGGGMITMPMFLSFRIPTKLAIGTSSGAVLITTLLGASSYLLWGLNSPEQNDSLGYIYLPAFICISLATLVAAPYGAKLAHTLPKMLLRRIFAFVLIGTGLLMAYESFK